MELKDCTQCKNIFSMRFVYSLAVVVGFAALLNEPFEAGEGGGWGGVGIWFLAVFYLISKHPSHNRLLQRLLPPPRHHLVVRKYESRSTFMLS